MSDEMNWLAVGCWSVAATYQFGMAIRDIFKERFGKRKNATEFQRIMDGETKNGWKLALARNRIDLSYQEQSTYRVVESMDPEFCQDATAPLGSSITLILKQPLLEKQQMSTTIYQHSLVRNGVKRHVLTYVYKTGQYKLQLSCYLTPRTILMVLHDVWQSNFRAGYHLVFVDCVTHKTQRYYIKSPRTDDDESDMEGYLAYLDQQKRLHIVFVQDQTDESRIVLYDVLYDLPFGQKDASELSFEEMRRNATRPRSWSSISIPVGNRREWCYRYCGSSFILLIHQDPDSLTGQDLCVSFDHKTWIMRTVAEWIDSFGNSSQGVRYLNAIRAFIALEPPGIDQWTEMQTANFIHWSPMHRIGDAVLVAVDFQGILSRWISPPPLKRVAAEAFFKANPNVKVPRWKEAIGFEMIDGL